MTIILWHQEVCGIITEIKCIMNDANEIVAYLRLSNNKTTKSKSFEWKTKIIEKTSANNNTLDIEVVVTLKCWSNFWRSLNLPLLTVK